MAYFNGFTKEFWQFFDELKENNNREWFTDNKERYKSDIVTPCMDFIVDMGERFKRHITALHRHCQGKWWVHVPHIS